MLGDSAGYRLKCISDGPAPSAPCQAQQDTQGSPDPLRKRLNYASWFPFMSLLPTVLITSSSCQDNLQGFLSLAPHYAVSVCTCRVHLPGAIDAFNLMHMPLNIEIARN